jgi:hypothetical protein
MTGGGRHSSRCMFANQTKQAEITELSDTIIVDEYVELRGRQCMLKLSQVTYWFQISMNELYSTRLRVDCNLRYVKGV